MNVLFGMENQKFYSTNIHATLAFLFISAYMLGVGLILWHAFYNSNPIANLIEKSLTANTLSQ